jgi:hypothetical protein
VRLLNGCDPFGLVACMSWDMRDWLAGITACVTLHGQHWCSIGITKPGAGAFFLLEVPISLGLFVVRVVEAMLRDVKVRCGKQDAQSELTPPSASAPRT